MPLFAAIGVILLICLAAMAVVFGVLDRKGALMSQTGLGTVSFLLLIGLVLYVAGGGGI